MSNKVSNFPNAQSPALKNGEMGEAVRAELEIATWDKIDTSNPAEVERQVKRYMEWCIERDMRPHVEGLALALKVTRQTLWNWSREGNKRAEVILWAKQILSSLHEEWGLTGKLNPVTYIFLAKNHFGYLDDSTLHLEAINAMNDNSRQSPKLSREEIAAKYAAYQEEPERLELD